eukprot:TRINITY_DN571_c0_g1_i1.p1 TRINITY_DN571_c0_g1~~TRINITY_DN571_c0_g1_i1.p1  ORF type:complete len:923 (+),score=376.76 TRINITY_DN571_c0_g1_i1:73-2841(+)
MSVFGVDLGDLNSVVSVARRGGIDIIANEISKRETESYVSFSPSDAERFIGAAGADHKLRNWKNTVTHLKRLIGLHYASPATQKEQKHCMFNIIEGDDGMVRVKVQYNSEEHVLRPEQIIAMLLGKLAGYANKATEEELKGTALPHTEIKDCVIACPPYYTAHQRRLLQDAAQIGGMNCLTLVTEQTAACLDWGIYKTASLPDAEADALLVYLVDLGNSATVITACKFWKNHLRVLGHVWDNELGCRDIDLLVADHFREAIKEKYKMDVYENKKAQLRLFDGCAKLRKMLSANPIASLAVESIMDDRDISFPTFKRDEFEEILAPVLARMEDLVRRASDITDGEVKPHAVELIGGGCRVPRLKSIIEGAFGIQTSTTLNASESVAKGCAIVGAMISPKFKVRDFKIFDSLSYPIELHLRDTDVPSSGSAPLTLFPERMEFPACFDLVHKTSKPFSLSVAYPDYIDQVKESTPQTTLGHWSFAGIPAGRGPVGEIMPDEAVDVTTRFRVNSSGVPTVEEVFVKQEWEVADTEERTFQRPKKRPRKEPSGSPKKRSRSPKRSQSPKRRSQSPKKSRSRSPKKSPQKPAEAKESPKDGDEPMATDEAEAAKEEPAAQTPSPAPEIEEMETVTETVVVRVRKEQRRVDVGVTPHVHLGVALSEMQRLQALEAKMKAADKHLADTRMVKNEVEGHVYDFRSKFESGGALHDFVAEEVRDAFIKKCTETEDWLYGDGEDETKEVYQAKLAELKLFTDPANSRLRQFEENEHTLNVTQGKVEKLKGDAESTLAGETHIPAEKLQAVVQRAQVVLDSIAGARLKLGENKTVGCELKTLEVVRWGASVQELSQAAFATPKPRKRKAAAAEPPAKHARTDGGAESPAPESESPAADGDTPMENGEPSEAQNGVPAQEPVDEDPALAAAEDAD